MRLLRTEESDRGKFEIEDFTGRKIPPYAILSHRWGDEEVTIPDMKGTCVVAMKGYQKVKKCCELARKRGFEYVWMDTCCIDKTSSVELSEAINSMYWWYQDAEECYAYLADVQSESEFQPEFQSEFGNSEWFARGWTL
jgi:hypothetical protein